ncbi:hypothetical protein [Streptococcus oriscaviae]|uniref:Na+-translocating membrane potential-generating system MpsC domain-containing protein n=1 Tax=Streptococcus oriscaviae TaxID=2781599 RepID=A0ABX7YP20_9STRE|nr:hypothetical protein [Streptococcus oriscaviae]QUE55009.1 hypothetical protein INT76_03775 [Streptococcus oriscaviae]
MLNEKNKATRIMKEIISYFLDNDLNDFSMDFHIKDGVFYLSIEAPCQQKPANFDQLVEDLQTERQLEVDEYFNALLGSHSHHDYSFLGKAIDKALGSYKDGKLFLEIWRYEQH